MKKLFKLAKNKESGVVVILLTIIISSAVILIAGLISNFMITQLKLAEDINNSIIAIYAADSGAEWQLYQIRKNILVPTPIMSNGSTVTATVIGISPNFTIKSLGSFGNISRQFELKL